MKIYTKTGDKGQTSLFGGTRIPKHHIRIESYGTVDELNSWIGLVADQVKQEYQLNLLRKIQDRLFTIGSMLATDPEKEKLKNGKDRLNIPKINEQDILELENQIDEMTNVLPQMTHFILPGGNVLVSHCHITRCVCRRAERLATQLDSIEPINELIISYLNRLSDYLFVLARKLSLEFGVDEIKWIPNKY